MQVNFIGNFLSRLNKNTGKIVKNMFFSPIERELDLSSIPNKALLFVQRLTIFIFNFIVVAAKLLLAAAKAIST